MIRELAQHLVIAPSEMATIDARTIDAGTTGIDLMERAGDAVVRIIRGTIPRCRVAVLAGPGNNGGDGWVIAHLLEIAGWPVTVYTDWNVAVASGEGDAAVARRRYTGCVADLMAFDARNHDLAVDALFGAGLSRPVDGAAQSLLRTLDDSSLRVIAVDLPSGLDGQSGAVLGVAARAWRTVTFGAPKPGHFLGRGPCLTGHLHVADIGLDLSAGSPCALRNDVALWRGRLPYPPNAPHKYARGGALVIGGPRHAGGAASLVARAVARAGAGAVVIAARPSSADLYSARMQAIMVQIYRDAGAFDDTVRDRRLAAVAIGPGLGTEVTDAARLRSVLDSGKPAVIDADALTILAATPTLRERLGEAHILTPHEGEFARLCPDLEGDALTRAQIAAERLGTVLVLKGATSVIAAPGRTAVLNIGASAYLATAGSGDVLTGIITGLLAQGVAPFEAAAAGVWIHAAAGNAAGPGLTADDLPDAICTVIDQLHHAGRSS